MFLSRKILLYSLLFIALPESQSVRDSIEDLQEDVAALKEFRSQQRDWNTEEDHRLSGEINEITKGQGTQNDSISKLEGRIDTLYRFGALGGFVIGLLSPFAWSSYRRRQLRMAKLWQKLLKIAELQGYSLEDLEMDEGGND